MTNKNKIGKLVGISLHSNEVLNEIKDTINSKNKLIILYAEMYQINLVESNPEYLKYFSTSNLILFNGFGAFVAYKFLFGCNAYFNRALNPLFHFEFIEFIKSNNWKIFLLGSTNESLSKFKNIYNNIVSNSHHGYFDETVDLTDLINQSKSNILFVGMGSPKQEKWIYENHHKLNVNVIISVGNAIEVLSENYYRPNNFIQKMGLEWFTRILIEPKRLWKRYLFGIPKFFYIIFKQKYQIK